MNKHKYQCLERMPRQSLQSRGAVMEDTPPKAEMAPEESARAEVEPPAEAAEAAEAAEGAAPAWLTAAFLREALASRAEGDGAALRVRGFRAESAVGKGDNYASVLLRVRVHVEQEEEGAGSEVKQRYLIVKSVPTKELSRIWVEREQLFPRERRMYSETLPRMHQLLRTRLRSQPFGSLAAIAYDSSLPEVLVFEDLSAEGFKMANRFSGLDLHHCLLAMRAMATFHALSIAMQEEDPASVDYEEPLYVEKRRPELDIWVPNNFESLAKTVETWEGFESFCERLRNVGNSIVNVILKMAEETDSRFKVIIHGDCWVNNMLFKYSETTERPIDIRFIDFQVCRFASLAFDLHYFLISSPREDIRTEKMEEMLSTYHATMTQVLQDVGCERRVLTWEALRDEVRRTRPFALMLVPSLLSVVLADPGDGIATDGFTEEDMYSGAVNPFERAMQGKKFAEQLQRLLPYFEREGLL